MSQPVQKQQKELSNEKRQSRIASDKAKQAISTISQGFIRKKQLEDVGDENKVTSENSLDSSCANQRPQLNDDTKGKKKNSRRATKNETAPLAERKGNDSNQQEGQIVESKIVEFKANQEPEISTLRPNATDGNEIEITKVKEFVPNEQTKKLSKEGKKGPTIGQVLRMRSSKLAEMNSQLDVAKDNIQTNGKLSEEQPQQVSETTQSHSGRTEDKLPQEEKKATDPIRTQNMESAKVDISSKPKNSSAWINVSQQRKDVSPHEATSSSKFGNAERKVKLTKGCKDAIDIKKQKDSAEKSLPEKYPWEQPGYADGIGMSQKLSEDEVAKECIDWTSILQSLSNDWNYRAATLKRIRIAIAKPFLQECSILAEKLSDDGLINALIIQTTDLRSSLVKEAFETIAAVSEKLGIYKNFWLVAARFLERACLASVIRTTKVIAIPAEECGYRIVASTPAEAVLPVLCSTIRFGTHPIAREKATNYLLKILKRGRPLIHDPDRAHDLTQKEDFNQEDSSKTKASSYTISDFVTDASALNCLKEVVTSAIGDSQGKTREAGLSCLNEMKYHWPEYTSSLVESLDPSLQRRAVHSLFTSGDDICPTKQNKDRKTIKELKAEARKSKTNNSSIVANKVVSDEENSLSSALSQVKIEVGQKTNKYNTTSPKNYCDNNFSGEKASNKSQGCGYQTRTLRSRTIHSSN